MNTNRLTLAEKMEKKKQTIANAKKALSKLAVVERKTIATTERRKRMLLGEAFLSMLYEPSSHGYFLGVEERLMAELSDDDLKWYNEHRGGNEAVTPPPPKMPPSSAPEQQKNGGTPSQT